MKYLEEFTDIATVLFPNNKSIDIFKSLCKKYKPHRNQVFDMEIVSILLANGLNVIATFNHKDFKHITEIQILEDCS